MSATVGNGCGEIAGERASALAAADSAAVARIPTRRSKLARPSSAKPTHIAASAASSRLVP
jgi:hypothetical protein